ncbi:MAG: ABC transporter permease [Kiritimatiellia bacterium]|jgi:ribose/xylose/arabinose/galactoside ABC-type transport system permease subunit|nr:ABC transporter permease [Kiritimatiellia bacterium]
MMVQRRKDISSELITLGVFCALQIGIMRVFTVLEPRFMSVDNLLGLLNLVAPMALVGLGLTFVAVTGYADMSFHFVSCFGGMTMSHMIAQGLSPLPAILIGGGAGAAFGVINGVMIGKFKLPDMVATLGLGAIAFGMAYLYSGGTQITDHFNDSGIKLLYTARVASIPLPVVLTAIAYAVGFIVLNRSTLGRRFYAIGSNATAARFSGVRVERYVIAAFVICAVVACLTNIIKMSALAKGEIEAGLMWLMPAYSAVFVGVSVFKKPTVMGTFLGALLIGTVQKGFLLLGKSTYVMELVMGVLLIVSIVVSRIDFKEIIRRRRFRAELAAGGGVS